MLLMTIIVSFSPFALCPPVWKMSTTSLACGKKKKKKKTFTDIKQLKDMLSTQVHFLPAV